MARRRVIAAIAIAVAALLPAIFASQAPALAQAFPTKPITLIVPWPAGGSTDISMRAIAKGAEKHLGQPIIIDNKGGASGTLGPATMAATAKPDGYTISQIPITIFRLPLMKNQKVSWNPDTDFSYIVHLTGYAFAVGVRGESPFKKWQDVIDHAKANPGKVTYGSPGAGTSLHIGMELIAGQAGIKLTHVPFKGDGEQRAAVLGGHIDMAVGGSGLVPFVGDGTMRALMIWTKDRAKAWPDVPTLKDLGYPWVFDSPFGVAGPKGMDPKIVQILHDAFKKSIEDPETLAVLDKFFMVANYADQKGYLDIIKQTTAYEKEALEKTGLAK
jgi:tripartite-type tricarboxylate transporter receptor subunit TctC